MNALRPGTSDMIKSAGTVALAGLKLVVLIFLSLLASRLLPQLLLFLEHSLDQRSWQLQLDEQSAAEDGGLVIPGTWVDLCSIALVFFGIPTLMTFIFYSRRMHYGYYFALIFFFAACNIYLSGSAQVSFVVAHLTSILRIQTPELHQ